MLEKLIFSGLVGLIAAYLLSVFKPSLKLPLFVNTKFRNPNLSIVALAIATALVIGACHNVGVKPEQPEANLSSCHMVKHFMGETCIPENPQRIISLYTTPLANLLALGIKPIAITPATGTEEEFPPYLADKVKGMELINEISYEPNLEKIAQLKPDLILGWTFHEKIYSLLSRIAPTLLFPQDIIKSPDVDWQKYTTYLATAFDKQEKAQQILGEYNRRITELKNALSDRYANETISIAHVSDEYGTEVYTVNSFLGSILSDLGLQRPQSQAVSNPGGTIKAISEEKLELIDGDLLFVLVFGDRDLQMLDDLLNKPLWRKLKAVQNGQVYPVDGFTWGVANPLTANAVIDDLYKYLVNTP